MCTYSCSTYIKFVFLFILQQQLKHHRTTIVAARMDSQHSNVNNCGHSRLYIFLFSNVFCLFVGNIFWQHKTEHASSAIQGLTLFLLALHKNLHQINAIKVSTIIWAKTMENLTHKHLTLTAQRRMPAYHLIHAAQLLKGGGGAL